MDQVSDYRFYHDRITKLPICNSVRELNFYRCLFLGSFTVRRMVEKFSNVRGLSIDEDGGCHSLYSSLQEIVHWKHIRSVRFHGIHESLLNELVDYIAEKFAHLEGLFLLYCENVTDSSLQTIAKFHGTNLKKISVFGDNLSHAGYHTLLNFQMLTQLIIFRPTQMTDYELLLIMQNLHHLSNLSISQSDQLFSDTFNDLFKDLVIPKLVELEIVNCSALNDEALKTFIQSLPRIRVLCLSDLTNVSDVGLKLLIVIAKNLETLYLYNIESISEMCAFDLAYYLLKLRKYYISGCPLVVGGAFTELISGRSLCYQ